MHGRVHRPRGPPGRRDTPATPRRRACRSCCHPQPVKRQRPRRRPGTIAENKLERESLVPPPVGVDQLDERAEVVVWCEVVGVFPAGGRRLVVEPGGVLGDLVQSSAAPVDEVALVVVEGGRLRRRVTRPVLGVVVVDMVPVAAPGGRISVGGTRVAVGVVVVDVVPVVGARWRREGPAVGDSSTSPLLAPRGLEPRGDGVGVLGVGDRPAEYHRRRPVRFSIDELPEAFLVDV